MYYTITAPDGTVYEAEGENELSAMLLRAMAGHGDGEHFDIAENEGPTPMYDIMLVPLAEMELAFRRRNGGRGRAM
jgi:hypothetical protein